jgi:putative membrane protein
MPRLNEPDFVMRTVERAEDAVDTVTGVTEDMTHAPLLQALDKKVADRLGHRDLLIARDNTSQTVLPADRSNDGIGVTDVSSAAPVSTLGTFGKRPCSASNPTEAPMKTTILALTLAGALASSALAQSVGEKTGVNSALGITPKTEDFIKEAATSDMLEIEAAKVAQQKGDADEKKFAEQMITDHTKTTSELKGMVPAEMASAIPTALDDSSQKKLDKLRNAKPEEFASDYDPMQVSAHEDAVSLFERYAKGGDNAKLKDWAGKTLPALQHHLQMAEKMNDNRKKD